MIDLFRLRRPATAVASLALAAALLGGTPARALDDDGSQSIGETILDLVRMGVGYEDENPKPPIEYRERAPIVLPPKMELKQPMPSVAARNKAWPLDQDLARVKKAQAEASKPRGNNVDADPLPARDLQKYGRVVPRANSTPVNQGGCDDMDVICDKNKFWLTMNQGREVESTVNKNLVAGVEPPRAGLTDPPKGYRAPTKSVKATFEPPDRSYQDNLGSGAAQVREEARRRQEIQ